MAKAETVFSDAEQVAKAKKDICFFEPLYDRYYEPVFRFVYQRMADRHDAYDLTAEVFCKAISKLSQYKDMGFPFSSWLYRIASNEISNFYRDSKKCRSVNIDSSDIAEILDENSAISEEMFEALEDALMELKESELLMVEMRFFEKRSFKEIAEVLNLTDVNAKIKTYRILEKLKGIMNKKGCNA